MSGKQTICQVGESRGSGIPRHLPTVHIYEVDYATHTLIDGEGRRYHEQPDTSWLAEGEVREGAVRYWGSGSHAGHINLCPMWYFTGGSWVNIVREKSQRTEEE